MYTSNSMSSRQHSCSNSSIYCVSAASKTGSLALQLVNFLRHGCCWHALHLSLNGIAIHSLIYAVFSSSSRCVFCNDIHIIGIFSIAELYSSTLSAVDPCVIYTDVTDNHSDVCRGLLGLRSDNSLYSFRFLSNAFRSFSSCFVEFVIFAGYSRVIWSYFSQSLCKSSWFSSAPLKSPNSPNLTRFHDSKSAITSINAVSDLSDSVFTEVRSRTVERDSYMLSRFELGWESKYTRIRFSSLVVIILFSWSCISSCCEGFGTNASKSEKEWYSDNIPLHSFSNALYFIISFCISLLSLTLILSIVAVNSLMRLSSITGEYCNSLCSDTEFHSDCNSERCFSTAFNRSLSPSNSENSTGSTVLLLNIPS